MSETTGNGGLDFSDAETIYVDEIPIELPELNLEENDQPRRGEDTAGGPLGDNPRVAVVERLVLNKYDGDLTDEQMAVTNPIERIVIQRGKVTEHYIRRTPTS